MKVETETVEIVRTDMDRKVRKTCASSEIVVVRDSQGQMRLCLLVKTVPKDKAGGPTSEICTDRIGGMGSNR